MFIEGHYLKLHTEFAKYYDKFYGKDYEKAIGVIHWIIQKYSKRTPGDLLDLMCGTGAHILGLSKKGYGRIVGVDSSEEMVKLAKKRLKNIGNAKIILSDVRNLNFVEEFDGVYCWFNSLQYFFTDDNLKKVLFNVNTALKECGLFIADLRNPIPFLSNFKNKFPISFKAKEGDIEIINTAKGMSYDENTHIATFDIEYIIKYGEKIYREKEKHSYRLISSGEFQMLLEKCGFMTERIFGSSTEINVPFDEQKSSKMVFVLHKATEEERIK